MLLKRIFSGILALVLLLGAIPIQAFAAEIQEEKPSLPEWKTWSQGDSRWGNLRMGYSWSTVAGEGCLVTAMTKLLIQAGLKDPDTYTVTDFLKWMNANGGFTETGAMLMAKPGQYSGLDYQGFFLGGNRSSKKYNDTLVSYAAQGYHMVLQVKNGGHWVAVDNELTLATGQVYIMDSLIGGENAGITLESRYPTFRYMVGYTGGVPYPGQPLPAQGTCGQGMYWHLDEGSGLLTISGQGDMRDYDNGEIVPWLPFAQQITRVQVEEGVTKIGSFAFGAQSGYPNLRELTMPNSLGKIGDYAFAAAPALAQVTLPSGLTAIGRRAFAGTAMQQELSFPLEIQSVGAEAFAGCTALETLRFTGNAPSFGEKCFRDLSAKVCYPAGDLSWTEENRLDYGGSLAWEAVIPPAPQVSAYNNAVDGASCLTWTPVANAASYEIWHIFQETGKLIKLDTIETTFYGHRGVLPGVDYYYTVRAVLQDGSKTSYSAVVCSARDLPQPQVSVEVLPADVIQVSWEAIDGAASYEVWRSDSGEAGVVSFVAKVEDTFFLEPAPGEADQTFYKVRALHENISAASAFSAPVPIPDPK